MDDPRTDGRRHIVVVVNAKEVGTITCKSDSMVMADIIERSRNTAVTGVIRLGR